MKNREKKGKKLNFRGGVRKWVLAVFCFNEVLREVGGAGEVCCKNFIWCVGWVG